MDTPAFGIITSVSWDADPFTGSACMANDAFTVIKEDQDPILAYRTQIFTALR